MSESSEGIVDRVVRRTDHWEDGKLSEIDRQIQDMVARFAESTNNAIISVRLRMHPETWVALGRWVNVEVPVDCNESYDKDSIALVRRSGKRIAGDVQCPD